MKRQTYTILVVEDDRDDQHMIERALRQNGVKDTIHFVKDGGEALSYLKGEGQYADRRAFQYPSIILTDLRMLPMDGFTVLEHLKKNKEWAVIPTVVLSSSDDTDDIKTAYALGASSYLHKPSSVTELRNLLKIFYDYWVSCEVPQVDVSGKMLRTQGKGKLGERFSEQ